MSTNDTLANIQAQKEKEKKINKARKKLRECQDDCRSFMAQYPGHAEARRGASTTPRSRHTAPSWIA